MSNIDKRALREAAEKAGADEWCAFIDTKSKTYSVHTPGDNRRGDVVKWAGFDGQKRAAAKAKFIAAANPATVLALLDELEAAEKRIAEPVSVPDLKPVGFLFVSDDVAVAYSPAGWPMKGFNLIGPIYGDLNACRAAMLQGADGTLTNEGTIPVTQFKPVADMYGLTSPTGSETSFTFDAVEARDFIDGGWSCQEYVELGRFQEAMLQNGNSPAQSDCCPEQNYIAPAQDGDSPVIPDGWVACVERMPSAGEQVLAYRPDAPESNDPLIKMATYVGVSAHGHGFDCYCKPTHWMPLPAAPQQEVKE